MRNIEDEKFPICERCWISENSSWEADSVGTNGDIVTRLTKIAIPLSLEPGTVHSCVLCDKVTIVGLFIDFEELDKVIDSTDDEEDEDDELEDDEDLKEPKLDQEEEGQDTSTDTS